MQKLQKLWTGKGVVWFTVISSAPGEQGLCDRAQENDYVKQDGRGSHSGAARPQR